jgi:hypothetical protein
LQGFNPKMLMSGCSGALRQEFRELELLDEIMRLLYSRKLPGQITGDTRNNIIDTFRKWRCEQYIPQNVHSSIRWSKCSPWLESEVLDLDNRLEKLEKQRQQKKVETKGDKVGPTLQVPVTKSYEMLCTSTNTHNSIQGDTGAAKRRSSGLQIQRRSSRPSRVTFTQAATKQKLNQPSLDSILAQVAHYKALRGCRWSQNSCAYDIVFTPLFALWCSNREHWAQDMSRMGNAVADLSFSLYKRGENFLENGCDDSRWLIAHSPNGADFGYHTSIETVCTHLLRTNTIIYERYYVCFNGHHVYHSDDYDAVLSVGVYEYESIVQWVCSLQCPTYFRKFAWIPVSKLSLTSPARGHWH